MGRDLICMQHFLLQQSVKLTNSNDILKNVSIKNRYASSLLPGHSRSRPASPAHKVTQLSKSQCASQLCDEFT